jgi:hypothetical protein
MHPIAGREGGVALRGLGAAVGGAVAAHHIGRAMPEQVLDVELAGVVRERPGGEGVAEAVGMDLGDPRLAAERGPSSPGSSS